MHVEIITSQTAEDRHLNFRSCMGRHAQHMTNSCKNVFIATLADFGVYLWRKEHELREVNHLYNTKTSFC